jgi:NAD(P)-dependent dehydrogenase (short-subunit alcohol dehydrogenase family)
MWNIKDKICLITGGTSGIGRQTALALARQGAHVVITYRDQAKARATEKYIKARTGVGIDAFYCELSDFGAIRKFADEFTSKYDRLDVLINNAGIWETPRQLSADGIELNFAVNHLAPFLLTNLLLDTLRKSAPARIITVSSNAHKNTGMRFDDIEMREKFNGFMAYSQSKLANILFSKHLAEMLSKDNVTVNCVHPGVVATKIFDNMGKMAAAMARIFMISAAKGAETSVYLATSDEVSHITGKYFDKKKVVNSSPASEDMEAAQRLWNLSLKYVVWEE